MSAGRRRSRLIQACTRGSLAVLPILFAAAPAQAQEGGTFSFSAIVSTLVPLLGLMFLVTLAIWALMGRRAAMLSEVDAANRSMELEVRLNEAEALIAAEPHLLFIWSGSAPEPDRVGGALGDLKGVPQDAEAQTRFSEWLEPASAETIAQGLAKLRKNGTAFNFVVRTRGGEALEADGRTAGGRATLRLRGLVGERLEMSRLAQDHRTLEQHATMLTGVLNQAPMPVWIRDHTGTISWANRAYLEAVEAASLGEVIERKRELLDPVQRDRAQQELARTSATRQRTHAVMAGARKTVDVIDVAFKDGSAGFAIDMTDLETAQNELRRHIQAHASTLDKLATAVAIFGSDQRIRFYNAAYAELWSLDTEWLNEQPSDSEILDKLREARMLPEQADYRAWKARQLDAYVKVDSHEDWWHLPDGQVLRVVSEQHPFGGVTYLYENVTEKIELERVHNELINVQRETLDNLNEGVALFGSDGRLKLFNPAFAQYWDLDPAQLKEAPHVDRVIERCRARLDDDDYWDGVKLAVTSLGTDHRALTRRIECGDGTVFAFASVPLPDGATLLTYGDITDSSRIEKALRERTEALEAADQLKSEFISNVSYELRTPLTNIIGFADGLTMGIAGELSDKQSEYVGDILASSNVLLRVIDAILDLATIDAGAMELKLAPVDLTETLQTAANQLHDRLHDRGLILEIEIPEGPLMVQADENRLTQILFNLLSNAIGFSPVDGRIKMGCDTSGSDVVFWITDMGKGIDPEFRDKVFDRFQSRPAGAGHRGPGLGLSLVKSFVELHGGIVDIESKPEEGTTVICRIPVEGPQPGTAEELLQRQSA